MINDKYLQDLQLISDKTNSVSDSSWDELSQELQYQYSPETLRKAAATQYGGVAVYEYFMNHQPEYASDEKIEQFEKIKDELYKERVRLQDANREKRNELKNDARYENLVEVLKEKIDLLEPVQKHISSYQYNGNNNAVAILSDIHFGMTIDNVFELYNVEIATQRLMQWKDKVIRYCRQNLINTLYIGLAGDATSGLIHLGQRVSQEEDVIDQIISISEILSDIIIEIAAEVNCLKLYGVVGNHCRVVANKNDSIPSENFERLMYEYIKLRTGYQVIQNGKEDFVEFEISGKKCVMAHGDADSIQNAKEHFSDILHYVPDYIFLGHVHHLSIEDDNSCMVVVNGSVMGSDEYIARLRKNTHPYQMLLIFMDGDELIHKINLD